MTTPPNYTAEEAQARETFLALMWSLSYPGRVYDLPASGDEAYKAIGDTLLDLETSFYTQARDLVTYLVRNGARHLPEDRAAYHFYPHLTDEMLNSVKKASIGSLMYPDESATLIIGCALGSGTQLHLSGPGIPPNEPRVIHVEGVPAEFWSLREKAIIYPRGWDVYLISGSQVVGLPRTTQITIS